MWTMTRSEYSRESKINVKRWIQDNLFIILFKAVTMWYAQYYEKEQSPSHGKAIKGYLVKIKNQESMIPGMSWSNEKCLACQANAWTESHPGSKHMSRLSPKPWHTLNMWSSYHWSHEYVCDDQWVFSFSGDCAFYLAKVLIQKKWSIFGTHSWYPRHFVKRELRAVA